LAAVVTCVGCAGGKLDPIKPAELPADLPPELLQKFQIQEEGKAPAGQAAAPMAPTGALPTGTTASTSPVPPPPHHKKKKRQKPFKFRELKLDKPLIREGEQQTYDITYFGMLAGTFTLEAMPSKIINDRKVYYIRGHAQSSKVFSLFYSLDDVVETFIDQAGMFSHRFHLTLDETKQSRDSLELFDSEKKETFYWDRWNHRDKGYHENRKFFPVDTPFSQDSLSALYFLRALPLKDGQVYKVPVVSQGKNWEAEVHVVRREIRDTPVGTLPTVVVKPLTKYNGVLKQSGDSFLWLTDDDRHILLRMEAKVKIGGVTAELVEWKPGHDPDPDEGAAEAIKEVASPIGGPPSEGAAPESKPATAE
jgi:hypothetical protein